MHSSYLMHLVWTERKSLIQKVACHLVNRVEGNAFMLKSPGMEGKKLFLTKVSFREETIFFLARWKVMDTGLGRQNDGLNS